MRYFTLPAGGLYFGKRLQKTPHIDRRALGLPAKIAFITDVHLSRHYPPEAAKRMLTRVQAEKPDLILLGGDYAESRAGGETFFTLCKDLSAPLGIFGVAGNNDTRLYPDGQAALARVAALGGVKMLFDETVKIRAPGGIIVLAGAHDAYEGDPPLAGSLFGDEEKAGYRILLAHQPLTAYARSSKPDLMLCGHTHGGQLNALGFTCYSLVGYENWFEYTHIAGMKTVGHTRVIVSRGIGVSKWPIRFGARPEIHILT